MTDEIFLPENAGPGWPERIPEIQTHTPVLGGRGGPVNVPHELLAARTRWLKEKLEELASWRSDISLAELEARATELEAEVEELRRLLGLVPVCEPGEPVDLSGIIGELAAINQRIDGLGLTGGDGQPSQSAEYSFLAEASACS